MSDKDLIERVALVAAMNCLKRSMRRLPGVSMALAEPVDELDAAIASMQADTDLERIKQERDQAVEALREAERAIAEYYRYWTGGDTRGSYDGKPERNGLWKAKHKARQTLASIEGAGHE